MKKYEEVEVRKKLQICRWRIMSVRKIGYNRRKVYQ